MFHVAMDRGINWDWFLVYRVSDDDTLIERIAENRFHKFDYEQGAMLHNKLVEKVRGVNYRIEEAEVSFGEPRMAIGITINGLYRPLAEPEPRFIHQSFDWETVL